VRDEEFPDSVLALEHLYQLNFNVEPQRKKTDTIRGLGKKEGQSDMFLVFFNSLQ